MAETVAGLVPDNLLQIEEFLDDLIEHFANDALLMEHVSVLRAVVANFPAEDDPEFTDALSQVRAHLSEVYRLDRRILRNRRVGVVGLTPKRSGVTVVDYQNPTVALLAETLEQWRSDAALRVYGTETSEQAHAMSAWFADLLDATLSDHPTMLVLLQTKGPEGIPDLANLRAIAKNLFDDETRMNALLDALALVGNGVKCVVFCSSATTADQVASFLKVRLGKPVERTRRGTDEESDGAVHRFLDEPDHRILVCDQHDEEGLNLQCGTKVVIHYDL